MSDAATGGRRGTSLPAISPPDTTATVGPLSLAAALGLPILRRAQPEVLAGQENLGRIVRWVHVLDVADPDDLLRGGELVLSTGRGPGEDEEGQRRFVASLSDQGAAGLLIELGYTYKRELPTDLVEEAAHRGLPLIVTRRGTRFVDITEAIHGALVDRRLNLLRRSQEAGDRLTAVVLERRGLPVLLRSLAAMLHNPVALENAAGQLVGFASYESPDEELLEAHLEYRRTLEPGQLQGPGWMGAHVVFQGRPWGHVTVLDLDAPIVEEDRMVLERGAQAIALQLLQEQHEDQLRARARGSFLADLMHGRMSEADAARRAVALGFSAPRSHLLAAAMGWRSERWIELAETPDHAWNALAPAVRAAAGGERQVMVGLHGGVLLLVCGVADGEPRREGLDALALELRGPLRRRGLTEDDAALAFAGGEPTWLGAGRRLERAAAAVAAAPASPPALWRDARHWVLADLLYALRGAPELLAFTRDQLGALFEARDGRSRELLRTLEAYLANSGRKAETARALHVTRQSLYQRLERLQGVLDLDLEDPDVLLGLHLAIKALRLTEALAPDRRR